MTTPTNKNKTIEEKIDIMLTDHTTKVMQASKKWDGYPVKKSHKELKQQIQALITEARIDELEKFTDIDTILGIPVASCSTCEDIYDNARERLTQLKGNG